MELKNTIESLLEKLVSSKSINEIQKLREQISILLNGKIKAKTLQNWNFLVEVRLYEIKHNLNLFVEIQMLMLSDEL